MDMVGLFDLCIEQLMGETEVPAWGIYAEATRGGYSGCLSLRNEHVTFHVFIVKGKTVKNLYAFYTYTFKKDDARGVGYAAEKAILYRLKEMGLMYQLGVFGDSVQPPSNSTLHTVGLGTLGRHYKIAASHFFSSFASIDMESARVWDKLCELNTANLNINTDDLVFVDFSSLCPKGEELKLKILEYSDGNKRVYKKDTHVWKDVMKYFKCNKIHRQILASEFRRINTRTLSQPLTNQISRLV